VEWSGVTHVDTIYIHQLLESQSSSTRTATGKHRRHSWILAPHRSTSTNLQYIYISYRRFRYDVTNHAEFELLNYRNTSHQNQKENVCSWSTEKIWHMINARQVAIHWWVKFRTKNNMRAGWMAIRDKPFSL
jgi:hypothetical protein